MGTKKPAQGGFLGEERLAANLLSSRAFPNETNINMSTQTKRVTLPADFVNIGAKTSIQTATPSANAIPVPVQLVGILLGVMGVMTLLNVVYKFTTGH